MSSDRDLQTMASPAAHRAILEAAADIGTLQSHRSAEEKEKARRDLEKRCAAVEGSKAAASFAPLTGHPVAPEELFGSPRRIALTVPTGKTGAGSTRRGKDAGFLQAKRDVERDRFRFNGGAVLHGANEGYQAVVKAVERELAAVEAAYENAATTGADEREAERLSLRSYSLATRLLRLANRTNSAGDCFEALQRLLASSSSTKLTLIPDSSSALPIEVKVDVGPFRIPSSSSSSSSASLSSLFVGPRFEIRATTSYFAFLPDADVAELLPMLQALQKKERGASEARNDAAEKEEDDGDDDEALQPQTEKTPATAAATLRSPEDLRSRGYFGRLTATYLRRLAAMPSCVLDLLPSQPMTTTATVSAAAASTASAASSPADKAKQVLLSIANDLLSRKGAAATGSNKDDKQQQAPVPSLLEIAKAVEPLLCGRDDAAAAASSGSVLVLPALAAANVKTEEELEDEESQRKAEALLPPSAMRLFELPTGDCEEEGGVVEIVRG